MAAKQSETDACTKILFLPVTSCGLLARTHLSGLHASKREHRTARLAHGGPLLQTTGGLARMVDEASDATFPLGVQVPVPGAGAVCRVSNIEGWNGSRQATYIIGVIKIKPRRLRRHCSSVCRVTGTRTRVRALMYNTPEGLERREKLQAIPASLLGSTRQHPTRS